MVDRSRSQRTSSSGPAARAYAQSVNGKYLALGGGAQSSQPANAMKTLNSSPDDLNDNSPLAGAADVARSAQGEQYQDVGALAASLRTALQVPDDSLGNTPWYGDRGLVTGNPGVRQRVQPVSFVVYLDRSGTSSSPAQTLNPQDAQGNIVGTAGPVQLQLNTSLHDISIQSKHVFNRTPSRTGMHVTLWGMQPDLITGNGTTGVFMNQFGLTDYFSVATINEDTLALLTAGLTHNFVGNTVPLFGRSSAGLPTGDVVVAPSGSNIPDGQHQEAIAALNRLDLDYPAEAFRVAAQDCFVEFLKLFQMNGNVWYWTPNYTGSTTGQDQHSPNAWSPQTGVSTHMQHARNNDVMTRGYVALKYRATTYLGYFKSLTWTQDATSPFQWKFNFAFQAERTIAAQYYPADAVAATPVLGIPPGGLPNQDSPLAGLRLPGDLTPAVSTRIITTGGEVVPNPPGSTPFTGETLGLPTSAPPGTAPD